jgi:hypothetical protein
MSSNGTTEKTLPIKTVPEKAVIKFETSRQGIQAWHTAPPNSDPAPNIVGIKWRDVEKALINAVKNGHYRLETLKYDKDK